MKKGFTLVELSIVLVIIGLLIGGILVAQSLIDSTKIQTFTRTLQQYEGAIGLFRDRYRSMPGDSSVIVATGGAGGNRNGVLEDIGGLVYGGEAANFWPSLQVGIGLDKGPTFIVDASSGIRHGSSAGSHVPEIDIGSGAGLLPNPNAFPETSWGYHVGNFNSSSNGNYVEGNFTNPATALSIDLKLDDGNAQFGSVRASTFPVSEGCALQATPDSYEVSDDSNICTLAVAMFTTLEN